MKYRAWYLGKALLMVAGAAIMGLMVMALWNAVIPGLFVGGRPIDYLHALGLLVLCRILFGGFRGRGGWHQRRHWRRWEAMTPEERDQFRRTTMASGCKPRASRT
jgi:predicted Co/Zn/Cd cation transporter (cation efflux family)